MTDRESGEVEKIPLLRLYHVFNAAQCEGLKNTPEADDSSIVITTAAEIVAGMPQPPILKHGLTAAYYSPSNDTVGMPEPKRFDNEEAYHAALFHELVHSTGHEKRLKRQSITERNGFGSDPYCKEELIAELGSAFLCGQAGIVERTIENSAAYLEGWLKQLQRDKTLIVYAAAQAQKGSGLHPGPDTGNRGAGMTAKSRSLKIEAVGDFALSKTKPRIRLSGLWLEKAGFKPGHRAIIRESNPGELTLQFKEQISDTD